MTIGFFNSVDKGYLENLDNSAAPLVSFRFFFTDNPNHEGKMSWNIHDSTDSTTATVGSKQDLTDNAYTMILTYNADSGEVTAKVTDAAGSTIISDTTTTSPAFSFTSAGFGWGGTDASVSNRSSVTEFQVETYSPVPTNEWLNLRNHSLAQGSQTNQYLTITDPDARIGVSTNTADPKAHWKIIETSSGSGEYQIINRWAVQQGIARSNLCVDAADSNYAKLSDNSNVSPVWYIEENIDTENQPLDYFIRSKSAFPSNDRLYIDNDQAEAFINNGTGWRASWRLMTAPEIDDSVSPPFMSVSFSGDSLNISASDLTLGAQSKLYSTPTLAPADWTPVGTAITGVSATNWIIAATNDAEFFKVISD